MLDWRLIAKEKNQVNPILSQTNYTAIFLVREDDDGVVACLARPFAHVLNPEICSAISFDSGTNSVSTWAMLKSVGSFC